MSGLIPISQLSTDVEKINLKEEGLVCFMASEVSVQSQLVPCLCSSDEVQHYERDVWQRKTPHLLADSREGES